MYKTLVLSLKSDIERKQHITSVLSDLNMEFEFFTATTPEDLDYFTESIYFSELDYNPKVNRKAVMATFKSHLNLLRTIFNSKQNTLVLEDDLIPVREYNFKNIDFNSFGALQLMSKVSCCSQFYNWKTAGELFWYFTSNKPTQAFDWELYKNRDKFNIQTVNKPIFAQSSEFKSNIAPDGY